MNNCLCLLLSALTIAVAGCAQHSAYVLTRGNLQHPVSRADKIAVTAPGNSQSRTDELYRTLLAELEAGGFKVVSHAEADFHLVVLLDKNAHSGYVAPPPITHVAIPLDAIGGSRYYPTSPYSHQTASYTPPEPPVKVYRESEGIRLSLYPTRVQQPAHLQTAWDGFVDSGRNRVPRSRHHALLKTLLSYFGQDFDGRAKLVE